MPYDPRDTFSEREPPFIITAGGVVENPDYGAPDTTPPPGGNQSSPYPNLVWKDQYGMWYDPTTDQWYDINYQKAKAPDGDVLPKPPVDEGQEYIYDDPDDPTAGYWDPTPISKPWVPEPDDPVYGVGGTNPKYQPAPAGPYQPAPGLPQPSAISPPTRTMPWQAQRTAPPTGGPGGGLPNIPINPTPGTPGAAFAPHGDILGYYSDGLRFGGLPRSAGPGGIPGWYYGGDPTVTGG